MWYKPGSEIPPLCPNLTDFFFYRTPPPPKIRQFIVDSYSLKYQVVGFAGELTFWGVRDELCGAGGALLYHNPNPVQGYLAHKKSPPSLGHPLTLGIGLR